MCLTIDDPLRTGSRRPTAGRLGLPFSSARRSGELLARVAAGDAYAGASGEYLELGQSARLSRASYDRGQWQELWDASIRLVQLAPVESPLTTLRRGGRSSDQALLVGHNA